MTVTATKHWIVLTGMIVPMPRPAARAMPPLARPAVWKWFTRRGDGGPVEWTVVQDPPRDLLPDRHPRVGGGRSARAPGAPRGSGWPSSSTITRT